MLFIIIIDTALLVIASLIKTIESNDNQKENIYQNKGIKLSLGVILIFVCTTSLNSFDRVKRKLLWMSNLYLHIKLYF